MKRRNAGVSWNMRMGAAAIARDDMAAARKFHATADKLRQMPFMTAPGGF